MIFHLFKFSDRCYLIEFPDATYAEKFLKVFHWLTTKDIKEPTYIGKEDILSENYNVSNLIIFKIEILRMIKENQYIKYIPNSKNMIIRYGCINNLLKDLSHAIKVF